MQFVGDAVMAVFGRRCLDDHAERAVAAAASMHARPRPRSTARGRQDGLPAFGLGLGLSTGRGRGGPARIGGTAGVHAGRRHRQSGPAPPAVGVAGRDGAVRGHAQGVDRAVGPSPLAASW